MRRSRLRTMLLAGVALAIAGALGAYAWRESHRIGDLDVEASRLAVHAERRPFTGASWRRGDPSQRGEMLAALMRRHRFVGQPNKDIERLLGFRTCYVDDEKNPCYTVVLNGTESWFVFYARGEKPQDILEVVLAESPR